MLCQSQILLLPLYLDYLNYFPVRQIRPLACYSANMIQRRQVRDCFVMEDAVYA